MGISVGDADVVDDEVDSISANGHASANGTSPPDFSGASSPRINGRAELEEPASPRDPVRLLEPGWTEVPSSASLLQPYVDRPWPSRQEAFEHALQLRMSQLTLSEFVEGPESTGDKWVEVFQWFSERRSMVADDRTCILHFIANHPVKLVFGQDERLLTADNLKRISDFHPCSQVAGDRKCGHLPRSPLSRNSRRACSGCLRRQFQSWSLLRHQWRTLLRSLKNNWASIVLHPATPTKVTHRRRPACLSTRLAIKARKCGRCSSVVCTRAARASPRSRRRSATTSST